MFICEYRDYLVKYMQDNKGLRKSVVEGQSAEQKKGRFLSLIKGKQDIEKKSSGNHYQCIDSRDFGIRIEV